MERVARGAAMKRLLAGLLASVLCTGAVAQADPSFTPFTFALIGDPQIGYGPGAESADARRFALVVDDIAAQRVPVSVVVGDLVEHRSIWQHWAYERVARRLPGRVLLLPGNHDVVDLDSLHDWRARHGPDHHDAVVHGVAFVLLNSETLRDTRISAAEHDAQWAFLERSLAAHRAAGRAHIVLAMHRPPFVDDEAEPERGENWPPASRARLLALARAHGVALIVAGHLHRTKTIAARDGLRIVVGAGSARSFDRSPIAWHAVRVERDAITVEQRVVADAPAPPFAVPGLPGWTPRLADFSLRHWLLTLAFGAVGVLAGVTARKRASATWAAVAWLLLAMAANFQLDLDEALRELARGAAKASGVFAARHAITGGVAAASALAALWLYARRWRADPDRRPLLALALTAPSIAWWCLSVMSNHHLGMLFNEGWWDLLMLASLAAIAAIVRLPWPTVVR